MKAISTARILPLLICLVLSLHGTSQIRYGSNNGKYEVVRGTKVYYEIYGDGPDLLLLHGGLGDIADFRHCIGELSKKFRVIVPDFPGAGRSEDPDTALTYFIYCDYMARLITQLSLKKIRIMGWSDGGITALLLARRMPGTVEKVIAAGPNYLASGLKKAVKTAWDQHFNPDGFLANNKTWVDTYVKNHPAGDWKKHVVALRTMWYQPQYFPRNYLETIKIPVMLMFGDDDIYTLEHATDMHYAIKGSELCVLPATSHYMFDEEPALVSQLAIKFFTKSKK